MFYILKIFSGDYGQLSISGTDYSSLVLGDKFRPSDTTYNEGHRAHGLISRDNVMQQPAGLHTDPSLVSSISIPSSLMGNILEQQCTAFTEAAVASQSLQSNWQVLTAIAHHIF